jgi:hypothetical protein
MVKYSPLPLTPALSIATVWEYVFRREFRARV